MSNAPTTPDEVRQLVDGAISSIAGADLVAKIAPLLRTATQQKLHWEYGDNEPFDAWRFADLGGGIWAAYCTGGHGALGCPWGLVSANSDLFGMDCGWYRELHQLFEDWFA